LIDHSKNDKLRKRQASRTVGGEKKKWQKKRGRIKAVPAKLSAKGCKFDGTFVAVPYPENAEKGNKVLGGLISDHSRTEEWGGKVGLHPRPWKQKGKEGYIKKNKGEKRVMFNFGGNAYRNRQGRKKKGIRTGTEELSHVSETLLWEKGGDKSQKGGFFPRQNNLDETWKCKMSPEDR